MIQNHKKSKASSEKSNRQGLRQMSWIRSTASLNPGKENPILLIKNRTPTCQTQILAKSRPLPTISQIPALAGSWYLNISLGKAIFSNTGQSLVRRSSEHQLWFSQMVVVAVKRWVPHVANRLVAVAAVKMTEGTVRFGEGLAHLTALPTSSSEIQLHDENALNAAVTMSVTQ